MTNFDHCAEAEKRRKVQITNAERIRRFTDCELVEFLRRNTKCTVCGYFDSCDEEHGNCDKGIAFWAKSTNTGYAYIPDSARFAESLD